MLLKAVQREICVKKAGLIIAELEEKQKPC